MRSSLLQIEQQLLVAGQAEIDRRRRRRRVGFPSITVASLVIVASGVSAAAGIGPVAALIGSGDPGSAYINPAPHDQQAILSVTDQTGDEHHGRVFRGTDGGYCVQVPAILGSAPPASDMSCASAEQIGAQLGSGKPFATFTFVETAGNEAELVGGIVPAATTKVTIRTANGTELTQAVLGAVWTTPAASGDPGPAARSFLAIVSSSPTGRLAATVTTPTGSRTTNLPTNLLAP